MLARLGKQRIILGFPWLNKILLAYVEDLTEQSMIWINTKTSSSIEFHLKHDEEKKEAPLDKQIPTEYHEYLDVFDEEKAINFRNPDHGTTKLS